MCVEMIDEIEREAGVGGERACNYMMLRMPVDAMQARDDEACPPSSSLSSLSSHL